MRRSRALGCTAVVLTATVALGQQSPPVSPGQPISAQPQPSAAAAQQLGAVTTGGGGDQAAPGNPRATAQAPGPSFSVLGLSGTVSAPVAAPYSNSALTTSNGQPQRSGDDLLNWRRDKD